MGIVFPKRKIFTKAYITSVGSWMCQIFVGTLFPYWEKCKIHFWSQRSNFLADGKVFLKRKLITKTWITSVGPWICLNYISTLFPYWEKRKIHFRSWQSKFLADGNFSQKGNYQPNDRELFLDYVSLWQLYHLINSLLRNRQNKINHYFKFKLN